MGPSMQSSHFLLTLIGTYSQMFTAADVSMEELIAGARCHYFNENQPAGSRANFAAACKVVCDARLPRRTSLVSVCVSACHEDARLVRLQA